MVQDMEGTHWVWLAGVDGPYGYGCSVFNDGVTILHPLYYLLGCMIPFAFGLSFCWEVLEFMCYVLRHDWT